MSHAFSNCSCRTRELSDLRHGARTTYTNFRTRQSRTARHDKAVLDWGGADRAATGDFHGQHVVSTCIHGRRNRYRAWRPARVNALALDFIVARTATVKSRRFNARLAVFSPLVGFATY